MLGMMLATIWLNEQGVPCRFWGCANGSEVRAVGLDHFSQEALQLDLCVQFEDVVPQKRYRLPTLLDYEIIPIIALILPKSSVLWL